MFHRQGYAGGGTLQIVPGSPERYGLPAVTRNRAPMANTRRLSTADILMIRRSRDSGEALASRYGVGKSLISLIRSGKRYTWVKPEADLSRAERAAFLDEHNGTPLSEILQILRDSAGSRAVDDFLTPRISTPGTSPTKEIYSMDTLHPNQQAKMMRLVAGMDQRLARLEQEQRRLTEALAASEDTVRKLERRLADAVVNAPAAIAPAVPEIVAPAEPVAAEPVVAEPAEPEAVTLDLTAAPVEAVAEVVAADQGRKAARRNAKTA